MEHRVDESKIESIMERYFRTIFFDRLPKAQAVKTDVSDRSVLFSSCRTSNIAPSYKVLVCPFRVPQYISKHFEAPGVDTVKGSQRPRLTPTQPLLELLAEPRRGASIQSQSVTLTLVLTCSAFR